MKLIVGVLTGSLGILSEAAHSGLDLIAAAVTFFAVRISGKPADLEHHYGHGKIENLSALFETVLLLVTCIWIIYEAVRRLFFEEVAVEASIWAFVIMFISIAVDITRSRALARAAKRYDSQALEADALHFSTDIYSSTVVIVGLLLVRLAGALRIEWLAKADAIAALGVAGIVIWISLQMGRRTVQELLDGVPPALREDVTTAAKVPGVVEVKAARMRHSGPDAFVDVTVTAAPQMSLDDAHHLTEAVEAGIRRVMPGAQVMVHVEPAEPPTADKRLPILP
jgi:cation diffusion facilitator family transporter